MSSDATSFDAIVIGSGISGGWAAKELCEKGLKTLVLERGRNVVHIKDYPTMNLMPWELPHRGALARQVRKDNPLITKAAGYGEDTQHFFIKDRDHPYVQEKPFDAIRGSPECGKSIRWGRAGQRRPGRADRRQVRSTGGAPEGMGCEDFGYLNLGGRTVTPRIVPRSGSRKPGQTAEIAVDTHRIHLFDPKSEKALVSGGKPVQN